MLKLVLRSAAASAVMLFGGAALAASTLSVNTALTTDDPTYKGLERFAAGVDKATNGEVKVRIFPGSQLGKDEDVLEQARAGAAVAVIVDGGRLGLFVPELGVTAAPYVFDTFDEARKFTTSPVFEEWSEKLRKATGHQIFSFNWYQGSRHLLTNKPIKVPADLAGIRMRTPGAPVWMETVRAMGATPTPMGWTEVYPAIQQKVIDGCEAQLPAVYGARLYEVTKYITKTSHFFLITGLVGSAKWFDSLTEPQRKAVREQALVAGDWASKATIDSLADYQKKMEQAGVTFSEPDLKPFKEATKVVYSKVNLEAAKAQVDKILGR
jgi:tripartite ATP-independent transporter DctP family solute receptor